MKQKRARPACRIEHPLFDRPLDRMTHDLRRQPVGRVVLAETVPLLAVDQQLVEYLQDVAFDLIEAEAPDMGKNARTRSSPVGSATTQSKKSLSAAPKMPAASNAAPDSTRRGLSSRRPRTASAMAFATMTRKVC